MSRGKSGSDNPAWKGDEVGYHAAHSRFGDAKAHTCPCGQQALDWSYIGGAPDERLDKLGRRYSPNPDYYQALCRGCHARLEPRNAKLTWEKVQEIRVRYTGAFGEQTALAREYGVSSNTINDVVNHRKWREVR